MATADSVHLLVLLHGMWGNPSHLAELKRIMSETQAEPKDGVQLQILVAENNTEESTYDGVDWGGERVAEEILDQVATIEAGGRRVTRFSVTGYSMGGLTGRYAIGVLHQRGFFEKVQPVNFNTFTTPHIGIPRYPGLFQYLASTIGPRFLSRTGEQFYVMDKWSPSGRPLLEVMSDPDRIFYQALLLFPNVTIYANAVNDITVPYVTGGIELEDPFFHHEITGLEIEFDEQYEPLLKSWRIPDTPPPPIKKPTPFTREWFNAPPTFPLPPRFNFKFPFNMVIYAALPILLPALLASIIVRLSSHSRRSRTRIRLLERDESYAQRLVHAVAAMEHRVESAVVGALEDSAPPPHGAVTSSAMAVGAAGGAGAGEGTATRATRRRSSITVRCARDAEAGAAAHVNGTAAASKEQRAAAKAAAKGPVLTDSQRRIVHALNGLPQLRKERAFIHPVRNAHATIVARDVQNFEFHKMGWGVIRHWADHFEV